MLSNEVIGQFMLLCGFSIPIISALWKVFNALTSMKNELRDLITSTRHELEKKDLKVEALQENIVLSVNGLRERLEHLGTRHKADCAVLDRRIGQIEGFLVKTTSFELRQ